MALKRRGGGLRDRKQQDGQNCIMRWTGQVARDEKCTDILVRNPQIIHWEEAGVRGRIILQQKYDGSRRWTELAKGTDRWCTAGFHKMPGMPPPDEHTYTPLSAASYFTGWPQESKQTP